MKKQKPNVAFFNDVDLLTKLIEDSVVSQKLIYYYGLKELLNINQNHALAMPIKVKVKLDALIEIIRRIQAPRFAGTILFNSANVIYESYQYLQSSSQEQFYVIYLDFQKRFIKDMCLFVGTINTSLVHPREIFKYAYLLNASFIICIHNHPSGDLKPSFQDLEVTKKINEIGKIHSIILLDHIIIGNGYYSFFDNHML